MNSTLGSVVPLAMFLLQCKSSHIYLKGKTTLTITSFYQISWYLIHYTFRKNQIAQETTFARGTNFHFCPHRWTALLPVVENRDTVYRTPSQSVPSHICRAAFPECLCQICATQIHCWIDTCHDKGVHFISTLPLDAPVLSCCAQCAHCAVWVPSIRTSWDISWIYVLIHHST